MASLRKNKVKVAIFQRMLALADWLAGIPNRMTPPPFRLIQIGSAFWESRALYVAARLELADALRAGPKTTEELAQAYGLHEDHLYRLMRMLASRGIFYETAHRRFRNSKISEYLRQDHPHSVRAMVLMHNDPIMTRPWIESLETCIRSGDTPFVKSNGTELFDYMDRNPDFDRLFSEAMDSVEGLTGDAYLGDFDWNRFDRVIDVGGSRGTKSLAILKKHPRLRAMVFDRPQVVEEAKAYWRGKLDADVSARFEFAGGDMLDAVPEAESDRDIYMFMAVFHGFSDADALTLLANVKHAIRGTRPAVLIVDSVAAQIHVDPNIAAFDMQMLIGTRGRERTMPEWSALAAAAGFEIQEVVPVRTFAKFLVLRPSVEIPTPTPQDS